LEVVDVVSLMTADAHEWVAGRYRVVVVGEPFGEDPRSVGDHIHGTLSGRDVADDRTSGDLRTLGEIGRGDEVAAGRGDDDAEVWRGLVGRRWRVASD
jgi:hypothetical protein